MNPFSHQDQIIPQNLVTIMSPPSSGSKNKLFHAGFLLALLFDPQDADMFIRNVG
jgi:hypothetical protein